jgi:hypothetical protein
MGGAVCGGVGCGSFRARARLPRPSGPRSPGPRTRTRPGRFPVPREVAEIASNCAARGSAAVSPPKQPPFPAPSRSGATSTLTTSIPPARTAVAGNSSTPSNPPMGSSAAATCTSAWVSTPPVMARASTMVNVIPFLWLKGWHAPAGRRTCEPRPLIQARQIRPAAPVGAGGHVHPQGGAGRYRLLI